MPSLAEQVLTDEGVNKIASLVKWLVGSLLSFCVLMAGIALKASADLAAIDSRVNALETQTATYQNATDNRIDRLERQFDSIP